MVTFQKMKRATGGQFFLLKILLQGIYSDNACTKTSVDEEKLAIRIFTLQVHPRCFGFDKPITSERQTGVTG